MTTTATYEPVEVRDAFDLAGIDARRTQAALLLSIGAAVAGEPERAPTEDGLVLPPLEPLSHPERIPLSQAASQLDVSTADYVAGYTDRIPSEEAARLTHTLFEAPEVNTAAALVEAGLHNPSRLVRTAAAIAALDTTGPREDVVAELVESAQARDRDTRELARTGLAWADPDNPLLDRYVINRPVIRRRGQRSNTAVISHGTWAARTRWWRPGGDFYAYLDGLSPSLHLHDSSYSWSGAYSHIQRRLAADDLIDWVAAQNLERPDYFAHSHGATVANLATSRGLGLGRLVTMGLPVHGDWLPDLSNVDRLIDVRVRSDLVILADRGSQRLPRALRNDPKVTERRHGWFSHASTHDPAYWDRNDIPSSL